MGGFREFLNIFKRLRAEKRLEELSTRCGRCSHILPDETLTFCPKCGIPFSKVPPTHSYSTLAERAHHLLIQKYRWRLTTTTLLLFVAFWALLASISNLKNESLIASIQQVRPLHIYILEDEKYPKLTSEVQLHSIAIAAQAIKNHFGLELNEIKIIKNKIPPHLASSFPNLFESPEITALSFWESQVFSRIKGSWEHHASEPLQLLYTNIPIINDMTQNKKLETAHLNAAGIVSGLGHPNMSLVSSYRMQRESEELMDALPGSAEFYNEQAKFMGEYLITHELGHALLAIPDQVMYHVDFSKTNSPRAPASIETNSEIDYAQCIMHSDAGGGYRAWEALKNEKSGERSCYPYKAVLEALKLRNKAVEALKQGDKELAFYMYEKALNTYNPKNKTWLRHQWEQERTLSMSFIRRWLSGFFVIESHI